MVVLVMCMVCAAMQPKARELLTNQVSNIEAHTNVGGCCKLQPTYSHEPILKCNMLMRPDSTPFAHFLLACRRG
jgi:hypothetical protein